MSPDPTSPTRTPTLFAEDSHASPTHKLDSKKEKPTPDTSGQKCLDLSGNAGPLGLLEKTLLESPNWAWTKYSMTWKTKATPQGHLIFQLARQAHRTSVNASGSSRTPKARANQKDNSTSSTRPRPDTKKEPTRHMGDTKHNGSLTSPTPGTVLRQSEEQKGKEEIGESTRASGASRNVADSSSVRLQEHGHSQTKDAVERSKNVADPKGERHGGGSSEERGVSKRKLFEEKQEGPEVGGQVKGRSKPCSYRSIRSEENYWSVEPNVGRLVNGLPNRVPQLRALGNSVIPQIIEEIGYAIKKAETSK